MIKVGENEASMFQAICVEDRPTDRQTDRLAPRRFQPELKKTTATGDNRYVQFAVFSISFKLMHYVLFAMQYARVIIVTKCTKYAALLLD